MIFNVFLFLVSKMFSFLKIIIPPFVIPPFPFSRSRVCFIDTGLFLPTLQHGNLFTTATTTTTAATTATTTTNNDKQVITNIINKLISND